MLLYLQRLTKYLLRRFTKRLRLRKKAIGRKYPFLRSLQKTQEFGLFLFFGCLFLILILRLFYIQIIQAGHYEDVLSNQHVSESTLKADRGHVYVTDKSGKEIKLTENITLYTVFVDPEFVYDKERFVNILTPLVYYHLCDLYSFDKPSPRQCIKNVGSFIDKELLPTEPPVFYYGSGIVSNNYYTFDRTGYNATVNKTIEEFTPSVAKNYIKLKLSDMIKSGYKRYNYLGFFENANFLTALERMQLPYIAIEDKNYVYIDHDNIGSKKGAKQVLTALLEEYGYANFVPSLDTVLEKQKHRYVRLISDANPLIAQMIVKLKAAYYYERSSDRIPLLHGLGLESYTKRYYPYKDFMSHTIGYVNKEGDSYYGIEEFYDQQIRGKDGAIRGRSSAWIGQVGANDFEIESVEDGVDIFLTIDPSMQKEIEKIAKEYQQLLRADSISILVYDPFSGQVKTSVTYPNFDPNQYWEASYLQPLTPEFKHFIDDETYIDVPVFVNISGTVRTATMEERFEQQIPKYIARNIYGSIAFIDKNIAFPYDPGSIFKALTYAIGLDTKEISSYEFYEDPDNFVKIDQYTIENANDICQGTHSFLFALQHSCNVGIVRIVQKLTKYVFYNYLEKLGFGRTTQIELAGEEPGFMATPSTVSTARFLNNSFGLGILVTPIQVAAAYGTLVNSGQYIKPTIIDKICKPNGECTQNQKKVIRQVFASDISSQMLTALVHVVQAEENKEHVDIPGYSLGGKSGTSALVFKGEYMEGNGWTNASYVGVITEENPRYVVVVQVRRPRRSQWGVETAGKVFREVASFLLGYELLDS